MAELSEMLGQMLNDPGTMDKLRAFFDERKMPEPPPPPPGPESALQSLDPKTLSRVLAVVQAMNSGKQDGRTRLLYDLKPYISESRGRRVDEAAQILRLISVMDVFGEGGE